MKLALIGGGAMGRLVSARASEEGHEIGAVVTSSHASLAPEELADVLARARRGD